MRAVRFTRKARSERGDGDQDSSPPTESSHEATIFTGWLYDHLLPHAEQVMVAHPLMLRAMAAAKKKNGSP